jgi:serine/threonine protein kinase
MRYKKGPFIGKGTTSEVFECFSMISGELLALKLSKVYIRCHIKYKIYGDSLKVASYLEGLKKEFANLKSLNHNNIIKYHGCEIVEVKNDFTIGNEYYHI